MLIKLNEITSGSVLTRCRAQRTGLINVSLRKTSLFPKGFSTTSLAQILLPNLVDSWLKFKFYIFLTRPDCFQLSISPRDFLGEIKLWKETIF